MKPVQDVMITAKEYARNEFGLSRAALLGHDLDNPQTAAATFAYLEDQRAKNKVTSLKAFMRIKGMNHHQIHAFREFKLSRVDMEGHNFSNNLTAEATFAYLEDQRSQGIAAKEAIQQIKGMSGGMINALHEFGLSREEIRGHGFAHDLTAKATLAYLRDRCSEGATAQEAFADIKGMFGGMILVFREFGLSREEMEGHAFADYPTVAATLAYLRTRPEGVTAQEAFADIKGVWAGEIKAFHEFGLSKEEMKGHAFGERYTNEETFAYLRDRCSEGRTAREAFADIKGIYAAGEIRALHEFGLSKEEMEGHDFSFVPTTAEATFAYLRARCAEGVTAREAFADIKGMCGGEIKAFHEFGLSREEMEGHHFANDETAEATLAYLRDRCSEGRTAREAFADIKGGNADQIKLLLEFGFPVRFTKGYYYNNDEHREVALSYLHNQRSQGVAPEEAYRRILGKDRLAIIAMDEFGLSDDDTRSSNFSDFWTAQATFDYLLDLPAGITPKEGFQKIKGMNEVAIKAAHEFGLTESDMGIHFIDRRTSDYTTKAIFSYLRARPEGVTAQEAFAQIRGMDYLKIAEHEALQKRAMKELGLTGLQVYLEPFNQEKFLKLQSGTPYAEVMPEAVRKIDKRLKLWDIRREAISGFLGKEVTYERGIGDHIGRFLENDTNYPMSKVNKASASKVKQLNNLPNLPIGYKRS